MEFVIYAIVVPLILVVLAEVGIFKLVAALWPSWRRRRAERAFWWRSSLEDRPSPPVHRVDWSRVVMASAIWASGILVAVVAILLLGVPPDFLAILPVWLSVLAFLVLRLGWPRASGYRNPSRYRLGVALVAAGLICVWLVPLCLYLTMDGVQMELQGLLYLLGVGFSFGIIGGGIDQISKANYTPRDDFWDTITRPF